MKELLSEIRDCTVCTQNIPLGPNPVLRASSTAKIIIIGQAPGTKVHQTGIPWDDPSGNQLRKWMQITDDTFYDESKIAIVPMGFCYPGKGKSGDLPPRPECAPLWHKALLDLMPELKLTLLIGTYAQNYYLDTKKRRNLTETVRNYESYLPSYFVLPHPSPRNRFWMSKNQWFENDVVPVLRDIISASI